MKRALVIAPMFALLAPAGAAHAQMQAQHHSSAEAQPSWRLLAFKTVAAGTDNDTVRVNANRAWRQLRLCAINAPIHMQSFRVLYRNGGSEDVRLRDRIGAGTCTRAIALRDGHRRITQIRLAYARLDRSMRTPLVRIMSR